ncbi:MAG: SPOR domain-containing protein [Hyphomicrobiaceae bacterium]
MMRIVRTVVMAVAMLGLGAALPTVVEAKQASKQKSAGKAASDNGSKGSRDAEASLDRARRALDEGKFDAAQQLANSVLMSDSKDARSTARALAIRGEAYLRQNRPAEAIADLESALWLKGGLAGHEREVASAARSKAMQQGGLAAAAPVVRQSAPPAAPAVTAPPQPMRTAVAAPIQKPSTPAPAWSSAVKSAPLAPARAERVGDDAITTGAVRAPRSEVASLPSARPGEQAWSAAARPAPAPPQAAAEAKSAGSGIGGFFSSLFGGSQSGSSEATPTTTAAVSSSEAAPRRPATSSSEPQRISSAPAIRPAAAATAPVRTAAMMAPVKPAPPAISTDGMYKLQLAAVRTKAEAQEMADRVRTEEAALVGSRTFEIVEDVYGNMGRFYRVRIGAFPEPTQALSVCAALRDRRMDCMVLDH